MEWLSTPYTLRREDSKDARFYWLLEKNNRIKKYMGITSLSSKVVSKDERLIKWQTLEDPDGRLLELSAEHGTLEHEVIDRLDRRMEWKPLLENYKYDRMILGAAIAWKKFCDDYEVEVIASELMLKWEKGKKKFACTLDKVVWLTFTDKIKKEVEDGVYQRGPKKGEPKFKTVTEEVKTRKLAVIDLKSNFFEKDSKTFYEAHQFQLWGQRMAFRQTYPDLPDPLMFNWSPNNWRARTNGNLDNTYTLYQWKDENYKKRFDLYLQLAWIENWYEPSGKIEVFDGFENKGTPIEEAYKVMDYDEYVKYKLEKEYREETLESLKEFDLSALRLMVDEDELQFFTERLLSPNELTPQTELTEDQKTELRDFCIDWIIKNQGKKEIEKQIIRSKAS